jgi:hypothetical protein
VFGDDPVALWTSLLPRAQSIAVEAGYRVSGRFGWGSGSSLARWVMVAEGLPDRDDKQWFRAYVVPKTLTATLKGGSRWGSSRPPASTMQSATKLPARKRRSVNFESMARPAFASFQRRRAGRDGPDSGGDGNRPMEWPLFAPSGHLEWRFMRHRVSRGSSWIRPRPRHAFGAQHIAVNAVDPLAHLR